jgi:hypothetical protein
LVTERGYELPSSAAVFKAGVMSGLNRSESECRPNERAQAAFRQ